jgi:hypothetical protein
MKQLKYAVASVAILALAGVSSVSASVIYDGGSPDQGGTIFSYTPFDAAMSFTLTSSEAITGANWWGDCFPATTCGSTNFTLSIWTDSSGTPGTVLDFRPVGGNQAATGKDIVGGYAEYSYSATFGSFTIGPGTYFLAIQATEGGPWGWETTSSAPAGVQLQWFNGAGWTPLPEDLAFQLTSSVATTPVPAALPLFVTGLGGLGLLGWRKRRKALAAGA